MDNFGPDEAFGSEQAGLDRNLEVARRPYIPFPEAFAPAARNSQFYPG